MKSWVCFLTNDFNGDRQVSKVDWDGIFDIDWINFKMEGTFRVNKSLEELVWVISFQINDIVYGNNQDLLLFSYDFSYESLSKWKICLPNFKRSLWYLKLKTWLNFEEERFLRDYLKFSNSSKESFKTRYDTIQEKIQKNIIEERERIMHLLNDEKWHSWWIELF